MNSLIGKNVEVNSSSDLNLSSIKTNDDNNKSFAAFLADEQTKNYEYKEGIFPIPENILDDYGDFVDNSIFSVIETIDATGDYLKATKDDFSKPFDDISAGWSSLLGNISNFWNNIADIKTYDENGYDENGYDENGYNRQGYDEKGFGLDGYNAFGFDEDGYSTYSVNLSEVTQEQLDFVSNADRLSSWLDVSSFDINSVPPANDFVFFSSPMMQSTPEEDFNLSWNINNFDPPLSSFEDNSISLDNLGINLFASLEVEDKPSTQTLDDIGIKW